MTGFDPTAPDRDTDRDAPEQVEGNVVPPHDPTGAAEHDAADDASADVADDARGD